MIIIIIIIINIIIILYIVRICQLEGLISPVLYPPDPSSST
jgi:hypothetical protein